MILRLSNTRNSAWFSISILKLGPLRSKEGILLPAPQRKKPPRSENIWNEKHENEIDRGDIRGDCRARFNPSPPFLPTSLLCRVCREGERNDFPPRFKGIPLGTLGSIRRRMRPTIRESMRRVCISIRRRRTRRGTSVREQEEKRDYTTAAGIKKNKVIRSEFLARPLTTFSWARWIFMDEWRQSVNGDT